jgi:hypothetical protein
MTFCQWRSVTHLASDAEAVLAPDTMKKTAKSMQG